MSWLSEGFNAIFDPGKKDREKSTQLYESSINRQAQNEAYWKDLTDKLLYGTAERDPATGAIVSKPGQDAGAMDIAKDWEGRFFNFLETAPDLTYNAQRGAFERGIQDAEKAMKSQLNARGLSGSKLGVSKLGELMGTRAAGLANLEGQRQDRRGQNIQAGAAFGSGILDRALNLGKGGVFGTQVPSLQNQYAGMLGQQAGAAGGGIGQDLVAEASRNMFDNMFKKTTVQPPPQQQAGGIGQNVLSRFITGGLFG